MVYFLFMDKTLIGSINPLVQRDVNVSTLPQCFAPFLGCEAETNDLLALLNFESSSVNAVSLIGPFGYGKLELAKYVGHRMKALGISVHYVDIKKVNETIHFHENILNQLAIASSVEISLDMDLSALAGKLTIPTLLILDNCDAMFSSAENDLHFQEHLEEALEYFPSLKLLTTSRRRAPFLNAHFEVYFLSSLQTVFAVEFLIQLHMPSDDIDLLKDVCELLENVPYSLKAVATEMKPPAIVNLDVIYYRVLYDTYIDTLAPHLKYRAESSIYMTYRQITPQCRKWSYWFITSAPYKNMPISSDNIFCLNELLKHSMIQPDELSENSAVLGSVDQQNDSTFYRVPRLVREFYTNTLGKSPIYIAMRPDVSLESLYLSEFDINSNRMLA